MEIPRTRNEQTQYWRRKLLDGVDNQILYAMEQTIERLELNGKRITRQLVQADPLDMDNRREASRRYQLRKQKAQRQARLDLLRD